MHEKIIQILSVHKKVSQKIREISINRKNGNKMFSAISLPQFLPSRTSFIINSIMSVAFNPNIYFAGVLENCIPTTLFHVAKYVWRLAKNCCRDCPSNVVFSKLTLSEFLQSQNQLCHVFTRRLAKFP